MPTPMARGETVECSMPKGGGGDERELAELEVQVAMEREKAEQAEADLAEAQSRSRQKRAEIEDATEQLRSLAEALDQSDPRRERFEQFMAARERRQHATSELQAHSGLLHDAQAKLEAARQHLEDRPAETEESMVRRPTLATRPPARHRPCFVPWLAGVGILLIVLCPDRARCSLHNCR